AIIKQSLAVSPWSLAKPVIYKKLLLSMPTREASGHRLTTNDERLFYTFSLQLTSLLSFLAVPAAADLPELLREWREDAMTFLRHDAPKIILVVAVSFIATRLLRLIVNKLAEVQTRRHPAGMRTQQIRTLAGVTTSVGVFVIVFVA